jgi:anti-sigma factor RsiW
MSRFRLSRILRPASECEHVHGLMSDYLDGELAPGEQERVEQHVAFCPRCRRVLANLRRTLTAVRSLGAAPATDSDEAVEQAKRVWRERSG